MEALFLGCTLKKGHEWSDRTGRNAARNLVSMAKALKADPLPQQEKAE